MSKMILLNVRSAEDYDLDLVFQVPEGLDVSQAEAKAAEVHQAYHASLKGSPDREDYILALEAAGFTLPEWAQSPAWDEAPGAARRRR